MSVVVVGLEHHSTPLDLLERVAVPEEALGKTLGALHDRSNLSEVVVLSTCLRTELYAVVERFHEGVADLQEFLATSAGTTVDVIEGHQAVLFDDAVTVHLFEIAAGLRSSVLGETEVLGQVRRAAERAEAERAAGPVLSGLFQRAVKAGRKVRSSTAIARGATSLSHVAVDLATARLGGSLAGRRVLVVGAGTMGEGIVDALAQAHGGAEIVVANRTVDRARSLARRVAGDGVGMSGLVRALEAADAVLLSTGSSLPVLDVDMMTSVVRGREAADGGRGPLVVVDVSVPRNVDPAVAFIDGVELLDMDDLSELAERALDGRRGEVAAARTIVQQEVERYRADERARGAAPIVSALRNRVAEVRRSELERHRHRLAHLDESQWDEVESVVTDILAKVLHQPTVALKEAAGTPRGERLVEALRSLFDL
ncbi:MAG TPA: glutamyl-tRNA reductase [Acidimicrobiales bacterium]|nr:glutamyl-tRNA reductase [Acidimicrobiales bacterium]